jgi:hypothetical protein
LPLWLGSRTGKVTAAVALLLVVALVACYVLWWGPDRRRNAATSRGGTGPEAAVQVMPDAAAQLRVPGATLLVPAGAVTRPTTAHLKLTSDDLSRRLPPKADGALIPAGPAVEVDLSGQQPVRPLVLTLSVSPSLKVAPNNLVLLSDHAGALGAVKGRFDTVTRTFIARLANLSNFSLAAIDPAKLLDAATDFIVDLFSGVLDFAGIRARRPACAGQAVKLPDGSLVRVAGPSTTGVLWPCLALEQGRVAVTVHSATASIWRVIAPDAARYEGSGDVDAASVLQQALFRALVQDRKANEGLILPQGEGKWSFDPDRLPGAMVAKLSGGMWFAEVTVFTVTFLADVFSGGQFSTAVKAAEAFTQLDKLGKLDCLKKAAAVVEDGAELNLDAVVKLAKAAVTCVPEIYATMHGGAELTGLPKIIIDVLSDGVTVVWGGFVTAKRNFMSLWSEERWLSWRIVRTNDFGVFVGTWRVHGMTIRIRADHTGLMDWNAGPCEDLLAPPGTPHCEGYANLVFDPVQGGVLTGRVTGDVYYKTWDTGELYPNPVASQNEPIKTGLQIQLRRVAPHVLHQTWVGQSDEQGNPYLCAAAASQEWHTRCNA